MGKVVVVTGVPGAGKSTVIDGAWKELRARGVEYEVVNFGDVMLELMRGRGVTDRDEMRKVPLGAYREIQREAAKRIASAAEKKPIIVDTHCLVRKPEGYYPGLPSWVLEELKPESIMIIEAAPEEVVRRRVNDLTRKRGEELLDEVIEHQMLNRATAVAYSAISGSTVKIIHNRDGRLSESINEMVEALV